MGVRQDTLLTVSAAADLAAEHGDPLSVDAIRRAARTGQIANAQRFTFGYLFTDHDFLRWLGNRPKPGPRPAERNDTMTQLEGIDSAKAAFEAQREPGCTCRAIVNTSAPNPAHWWAQADTQGCALHCTHSGIVYGGMCYCGQRVE